ncbi:hypothetical protein PWT90_02720 [Aphanocladium album]|nr:hypothetical protein PWT90_02720 [Aphanocladium album]
MRFTASVLAFAATALAAFDPISSPPRDAVIPAGKPFTVEWNNPAPYQEGAVRIELLAGKTHETLQNPVTVATADAKDKKYVWNVDASLGADAAYGLRIVLVKDDKVFEWSQPFTIKKADGGDSTVTLTSSQGVKTITISSASTSTTTSTTTTTTITASNTTTSCTTSSTARATHNTTTVAPTLTTTIGSSQTASQSTPAPTKPTSGAARAAGSVALIGGLVAAMLAL